MNQTIEQNLLSSNPNVHAQVVELIRDLNSSLGSCLFYLSCQSSLSKADTLLLIGYLASIDQSDNPSCGLSNSHLAVLMSLLYSFDLKILEVQQDEGMGGWMVWVGGWYGWVDGMGEKGE